MRLSFSLASASCLLITSLTTMPSSAALLSALEGAGVYDTEGDVTWLADPMHIQSSGYDVDGLATYSLAQTFVGFLNSTFYLGFNNWRLPVADPSGAGCTEDTAGAVPSLSPTGYNCTGGELGNLFYAKLSGTAGEPLSTSLDPDITLFDSIPDGTFWTSTENPDNSSEVFTLATVNGIQSILSKNFTFGRAWILRDGGSDTVDEVAVIPVPAAAWLFLSALGITRLLTLGRHHSPVIVRH